MHTLAISSMLVLSEQNLTFGLHCVCSSNDHGRRVGLALQKAGDWNSRLFNICGFPPQLFDSFAPNTRTKSGRYEQVRRKMNNRTGWNGSKTGKTTSKNTASHRMHLCLQQQGPQWVQRHQSLPSLSPADVLFQKQAGGKRKITHNDQLSINVDRQEWPTSNKERQPSVHGGSIPSLPTTRTAAICTNVTLGFPGSVDVDQGSPIESICGPRGEFLKSARNDQCLRTKSRADNFPAVPRAAATAGSSRPAAPLVHQGRYMALPSASPVLASAGTCR